jgi:hypothetical protein
MYAVGQIIFPAWRCGLVERGERRPLWLSTKLQSTQFVHHDPLARHDTSGASSGELFDLQIQLQRIAKEPLSAFGRHQRYV